MNFWRRIEAELCDIILISVVSLLASLLLFKIPLFSSLYTDISESKYKFFLFFTITFNLILFFIQVILPTDTYNRTTPGKFLRKLNVVSNNNITISLRQSFSRFTLKYFLLFIGQYTVYSNLIENNFDSLIRNNFGNVYDFILLLIFAQYLLFLTASLNKRHLTIYDYITGSKVISRKQKFSTPIFFILPKFFLVTTLKTGAIFLVILFNLSILLYLANYKEENINEAYYKLLEKNSSPRDENNGFFYAQGLAYKTTSRDNFITGFRNTESENIENFLFSYNNTQSTNEFYPSLFKDRTLLDCYFDSLIKTSDNELTKNQNSPKNDCLPATVAKKLYQKYDSKIAQYAKLLDFSNFTIESSLTIWKSKAIVSQLNQLFLIKAVNESVINPEKSVRLVLKDLKFWKEVALQDSQPSKYKKEIYEIIKRDASIILFMVQNYHRKYSKALKEDITSTLLANTLQQEEYAIDSTFIAEVKVINELEHKYSNIPSFLYKKNRTRNIISDYITDFKETLTLNNFESRYKAKQILLAKHYNGDSISSIFNNYLGKKIKDKIIQNSALIPNLLEIEAYLRLTALTIKAYSDNIRADDMSEYIQKMSHDDIRLQNPLTGESFLWNSSEQSIFFFLDTDINIFCYIKYTNE